MSQLNISVYLLLINMINAQLNKYKPLAHDYKILVKPPSLSHRLYQPSYQNSQTNSYQQSPKSKIACLNERLLRQSQLLSAKRGQSLANSRSRSRKQYSPVKTEIAKFLDMENQVRKKNALTKQKLASSSNPFWNPNLKRSLPPKSPFAVSQYLKSSLKSVNSEVQRKTMSKNQSQKALQQIVFVTDQSGEEADSLDEYGSVEGKESSQLFTKNRGFIKQTRGSENYRESRLHLGQKNMNMGTFTPKFSSDEQVLSPTYIKQNRERQAQKVENGLLFQSKFGNKTSVNSNYKGMIMAITVLTIILSLLCYQIIK